MYTRRRALAGVAALLGGCGGLPSGRSAGPDSFAGPERWPQVGTDATHRGVADGAVPRDAPPVDRWVYTRGLPSSPVASERWIVVADASGLCLVPLGENRPVGRLSLPGSTPRVPVVLPDGDLLVTREDVSGSGEATDSSGGGATDSSGDGATESVAVLRYRIDEGPVWERRVRAPHVLAPAVADGVVYTATDAGYLALDAADGETLWQTGPGVRPSEWYGDLTENVAPAVAGDHVAVPAGDHVAVLDRRDGRVLLTTPADGLHGSPVAAGDSLFVADVANGVRAFDRATGEARWALPDRATHASPAVTDEVVIAAATDAVLAIDRRSGRVRDTVATTEFGSTPTGVTVVGDTVLVSATDGAIGAVTWDGTTFGSSRHWRTREWTQTEPLVVGDRLVTTDRRDGESRVTLLGRDER